METALYVAIAVVLVLVGLFAWLVTNQKPATGFNAALVCPHCQRSGYVCARPSTQKRGVSGGKATAALLTGGFSLLAVGLSRKQAMTESHCDACGSTWLHE